MFRRLSVSLGDAADRLHASEGLRRGRLLLAWVEAVGPALARQAAPAEVQGDTLHLVCSGPAWSQEILLRQREILERLNPLIGGPPLQRIRCRTGRFQPVKPDRAQPLEPEFPWEEVRLDPAAWQRIDRLVSDLRDPELARSTRQLLVQLERRRLVAFQTGLVACPTCAAPTDLTPCRSCRREARARRRERIMARLGREPWLTRPDLTEEFPDLRPEEFLEIRTRLRSRLERDVWAGVRALTEGAPLPDPLRALAVELVMLSTGLPAHRLDARHVKHALGPTLARAYLENRAPGPWQGTAKTDPEPRRR